MKNIDIPPVWLVGFVALAYLQVQFLPGPGLGGAWADFVGGLAVGAGALLTALAVREFRRHRTTIHPHGDESALITSGIFRRSRNPIYLADLLILAGLIFFWDAVWSLPLIPLFFWILQRRFVEPEENGLRKKFRMRYAAYTRKTRRWF
ncbi:MAG: isoprenylcysteine carboxylmethyltransferase family protein [Halocynthiibacter sp.]